MVYFFFFCMSLNSWKKKNVWYLWSTKSRIEYIVEHNNYMGHHLPVTTSKNSPGGLLSKKLLAISISSSWVGSPISALIINTIFSIFSLRRKDNNYGNTIEWKRKIKNVWDWSVANNPTLKQTSWRYLKQNRIEMKASKALQKKLEWKCLMKTEQIQPNTRSTKKEMPKQISQFKDAHSSVNSIFFQVGYSLWKSGIRPEKVCENSCFSIAFVDPARVGLRIEQIKW